MASTHANAWATVGDRVTHVLGAGSERAPGLAAGLGADVVADLTELLDAVDVVDICSPTDTHVDYIEQAAAGGVPIVCEKPLGRTSAEAARAVQVCASAGIPLLVAHVLRFFPEYAGARERVVAGDIGEIATIRLDRSTYPPMGDGTWFGDHARSGGVVLDLMIHDVDFACWLAGAVERVYARRAQPPGSGGHVLATLRHTSGALTHIQGSWAFPAGTFRTSLEIAGSDGLLTMHQGAPFSSITAQRGDVAAVPRLPLTLAESPYVTQMRHFSEVVRADAEPIVTPQEAATAVAVCEAIESSITTGRAVTMRGET
jgi:predicted dehydrogenase